MKALSWDKGRELSWESSLTRTWWFPLPTHPRWHDIEKGQGQGFVLNSGLQLKYNILLYSILLQETPPLKFAKKCDDAKRYRADDAMRTMIVVVVTVILGQQFRTKTRSLEWIQFTMNERNKFLGKAPASFITESFFSFSVIAASSPPLSDPTGATKSNAKLSLFRPSSFHWSNKAPFCPSDEDTLIENNWLLIARVE